MYHHNTRQPVITRWQWIWLALLAVSLAGCSSYPMDVDEETWKQLPPERRAELARRQAELEHERRMQALRLEEEQARLRAENERQRLDALRTLYQRLGEGEVVQVGLLQGEGYFGKFRPIAPDSLLLTIGETRKQTLLGHHGRQLTLWLRYEPGKLALCSHAPRPHIDPDHCAILVERDWRHGQDYVVNVPDGWHPKRPLLRNLQVHVRSLEPRERHW